MVWLAPGAGLREGGVGRPRCDTTANEMQPAAQLTHSCLSVHTCQLVASTRRRSLPGSCLVVFVHLQPASPRPPWLIVLFPPHTHTANYSSNAATRRARVRPCGDRNRVASPRRPSADIAYLASTRHAFSACLPRKSEQTRRPPARQPACRSLPRPEPAHGARSGADHRCQAGGHRAAADAALSAHRDGQYVTRPAVTA